MSAPTALGNMLKEFWDKALVLGRALKGDHKRLEPSQVFRPNLDEFQAGKMRM
jgi:hypothetical protein